MEQIKIYQAKNEPVLSYMKGSKERSNVEETYNQMFNSRVTYHFTSEEKKF